MDTIRGHGIHHDLLEYCVPATEEMEGDDYGTNLDVFEDNLIAMLMHYRENSSWYTSGDRKPKRVPKR